MLFAGAAREPTERRNENLRKCDTIALARKIWAASQPIAGTNAEAYLRARNITAELNCKSLNLI